MLALKCYNMRNINLKITHSTSTYVYYLRIIWIHYLHCITCTTWYIHVHMLACMSHAKNIHFQMYMQKKWPSTGPNFPKFWENTPLPIPSPSHECVGPYLVFLSLYVPPSCVNFSPFIKACIRGSAASLSGREGWKSAQFFRQPTLWMWVDKKKQQKNTEKMLFTLWRRRTSTLLEP